MTTDNTNTNAAKLRWVEPEVLSLDVADTAIYPNRGRDRGAGVDCTKS